MQAAEGTTMRVNGTGAAVGVGEALTDIPRLSSVNADTHIEAFYVTTKVFKHIMDANETVCLHNHRRFVRKTPQSGHTVVVCVH